MLTNIVVYKSTALLFSCINFVFEEFNNIFPLVIKTPAYSKRALYFKRIIMLNSSILKHF